MTTPLTGPMPTARRAIIADAAGGPALPKQHAGTHSDSSRGRRRPERRRIAVRMGAAEQVDGAERMHTAERYERPLAMPPALRPWFTRAGRIPLVEAARLPFTHIPEPWTRLVLRHEVSGRRDAMIVGPRTRASYNAADRPASCLRLHIAPGAVHTLLGVAAADLTDRIVELGELPGPLAEFADRLLHSSPAEAMALLENALPQRISDDPADTARRALLAAAISTMSSTPAPVPEIAARLAVSERHLRTLFTAGIGLSPKHFARIARIRNLVSNAGSAPLSQIAATTGYYDQSHMTADFRALMGIAPSRFFGGALPAPIPCHSLLTARSAA